MRIPLSEEIGEIHRYPKKCSLSNADAYLQIVDSLLFGRTASQELLEMEMLGAAAPQSRSDGLQQIAQIKSDADHLRGEELTLEQSGRAEHAHATDDAMQRLQGEIDR